MNTAGIIAEYNPFHNGHLRQINEVRRITGSKHVVVVMSGNGSLTVPYQVEFMKAR